VDNDGTVRVHRVVGAVDCGRTVNPDIGRRSLKAASLSAYTAALKNEITSGKTAACNKPISTTSNDANVRVAAN